MRIFGVRFGFRWIVAGGVVAALLANVPAGAQIGPVLQVAPVGQPVPLISVGERDGVSLLEATTEVTDALSAPFCNSDPGVNGCLYARCTPSGCGLPAQLDETHPYSIEFGVYESALISAFGTANCTAKDINVGLDIDHTYVSDIEASVSTADGNVFLPIGYLLQNSPSCSGDNLELIFDDSAGAAAPACLVGDPAYQGTVRPHNNTIFANVSIPVGSSTDVNNNPIPYRLWSVDLYDVASGDAGLIRDVWIAWGLQCDTGLGCSISINPSSPTNQDLPIFTISGDWPNGCTPTFENGTVDTVNHIIRINGVSNPTCSNCTQVVTPYSIPVQVQSPLSAGSWQIQFYVRECSGAYQQSCSRTFQVTQPSCNFSISPASATSPAGGGSGSVAVTTTAGCGWNASSNASWITVTGGASGSGNGSVFYSVAQNSTSSTRTGTITIAGHTFTITQGGQGGGGSCTPNATTLCLLGNRFEVRATYTDYSNNTGPGNAVVLTADSGYFWFFSSSNVEAVGKVVSFCSVNGSFGFYAGGLTDVGVVMTVRDTVANQTQTFTNARGHNFNMISSAFNTCP